MNSIHKFSIYYKPKRRFQLRFPLFFIMIVFLMANIACGPIVDMFSSDSGPSLSQEHIVDEHIVEEHIGKIDDPMITEIYPSQPSRIEVFSITIPQLYNRERTIQVYLPPDYDTSDKVYPVFYLLDGAFLFNPPIDHQGDYAIDETLDRLFAEGRIEGMIAVGIELDFDYRWDEYSPWINHNMYDWVKTSNSEPIEGGEGFEFLDFIVNTLKPEIDTRYRTLTDRENTAIGGFCRTAIIPVVAGLVYPDVFSQVMTLSPTVWLAESGGQWLSENQLINYINEVDVPKDVRFFIHVGTEETSGNRPPIEDQNGKRITYPQAYIEGAEILYRSLMENGAPADNVYFEIIDGSVGGRDVWASRFDDAVIWLNELP